MLDRVVPPVLPGVILLGVLALLWWQFAAGHAWAAWSLALLTAAGMFVTLALGTAFWAILALVAFADSPAPEAGTMRIASIARACSYLAAFVIVVMELRSRARMNVPGSG